MNNLITITKQTIGNDEINAVDARDLHGFLESKQEFTNWIKKRIKEYNFQEFQDFIAYDKKIKRAVGASIRKEYTISVDMAKELSMVERNAKGKEARQYFIECEKVLKKPQSVINAKQQITDDTRATLELYNLFKVPEYIAQIETVKIIKKDSGVDISAILLVAPAQDNIKKKDVMLEPTELGKHFNLSGVKMNKRLRSLDLQYKSGNDWKPTEEGDKISSRHSWSAGSKSGYNLKWNLAKIKKLLKLS